MQIMQKSDIEMEKDIAWLTQEEKEQKEKAVEKSSDQPVTEGEEMGEIQEAG